MARVLSQQATRDALKAGIDTMAGAVTPTLGPLTGPVALDDATRAGSPELLDDGGTIARRILQLEDLDADVGAMLLRETLWRQREQYGDGAATAAALYQAVYADGRRFISAGGNAMLLRHALEAGMKSILDELRGQVHQIETPEAIERLALAVCGDADIAAALADIFDVLGPHGAVEVRDGGRELQHEFFLGSHWESKVPSNIVFEGVIGERIELKNTAWLISDFALDDLHALVKLVTETVQAGFASLVILAKSFSEQIIAAQGANSRMDDFTMIFLEPTGLVDEQEAALEDLAQITGGQVLRTIAGHSLAAVTGDMLGETELAWVDRNRFGIIAGGAGDENVIEDEIAALEANYARSDDERRRQVLRARIGRLRGGSAVVYAHGSSESEMRYHKALVTRAIATLRSALLEGILPGGGSALLCCASKLRQFHQESADLHEKAAWQILIRAAETPCRMLLSNAGHPAPGIIIDQICNGGNGAGYDLRAGRIIDMHKDGVVDSAAALLAAVRNGIGGAALALTVDTIVHRANPPLAIEPGGMPSSAPAAGNIELM
jgi:chaperonin GroEL